jgi:hypothetical protein
VKIIKGVLALSLIVCLFAVSNVCAQSYVTDPFDWTKNEYLPTQPQLEDLGNGLYSWQSGEPDGGSHFGGLELLGQEFTDFEMSFKLMAIPNSLFFGIGFRKELHHTEPWWPEKRAGYHFFIHADGKIEFRKQMTAGALMGEIFAEAYTGVDFTKSWNEVFLKVRGATIELHINGELVELRNVDYPGETSNMEKRLGAVISPFTDYDPCTGTFIGFLNWGGIWYISDVSVERL